jgi:hypothetical protein
MWLSSKNIYVRTCCPNLKKTSKNIKYQHKTITNTLILPNAPTHMVKVKMHMKARILNVFERRKCMWWIESFLLLCIFYEKMN